MRSFLIAVTRNWISLCGTALTTVSGILILVLFGMEWLGHEGSPYLGILAFVILPSIFVLGLLLIPLGAWLEQRRQRRAIEKGEPAPGFPVIDLNHGRTRKIVTVVLLATVLNVVILSLATYKGVEVMDSTEFCGTTCHTVMMPEYTTYLRSPHARVKCASCHIGPGADWFVKSKLSGSWQLVAVTFDLYPRPIPVPVHNLRPARETCEQCHLPTHFVGDRLEVLTHYDNDEANTELKTVLLLRVGGQQGSSSHGIHWHVDPGVQIRYHSDESREVIYDVEMTLEDGTVRTFRNPDQTPEEAGPWRIMDCVDCHNRPTHIYRMPGEEIDAAIQAGRIDRSLPYVHREGLAALQEEYESHAAAREKIHERLRGFYAEQYPDLAGRRQDDIVAAADALTRIYTTNVFPTMNIRWGTYPNHVGHQNSPGCFRCHDDEHESEDGEVISQDCFTCHNLLAMEEENPDILGELEP
ncbi:MAG: NapC/NirT family cytochrome c [Acidobacteriota bacterium]|jgi:hypothetical protein